MVHITRLPPGQATGADDLHKWSQRRNVGRAGVKPEKKPKPKPDAADRWLARHDPQKQEDFDPSF